MKKAVSAESGADMLASWIAYIFTAIMIGIFPLFFHDNYFDIMRSKVRFFQIVAAGFVLIAILLTVAKIVELSVKEKKLCVPKPSAPIHVLIFAGVFLLAVVVSTFMSDYGQEAFWGESGRRTSAVFWLLAILAFLMVGRYLKVGMGLVWIFLISNTLVFLLAILNYWGLDPLGMHEGLNEGQIATFISTIGNVNMNVSYDCLIYPIGLALFYQSRERLSRILYGIFVVIGCWGLFSTTSEGWILGVAGAFAMLLWFGMSSFENLKYYCQTAVLFLVSLLAMQYLSNLAVHLGATSQMLVKSQAQEASVTLMHPAVLWALLIVFAAGMIWTMMVTRKDGEELRAEAAGTVLKRARKFLFILLFAAVAVGIVLVIVVTSNPEIAEGKPMLQKLIISDSFGSGRGMIWSKTTGAWAQLPFPEKVFGYGPNCYRYMIEDTWGQEIRNFFGGAVLVDSHNEFLYILSTLGIVGVIGYFGLMVSYLARCFRTAKENPLLLLGAAAILASLLQGLVNSPQIFSTPLLFVLLGILQAIFRKQREPETESIQLQKQYTAPAQAKRHGNKGKGKKQKSARKRK